MKRGKIKVATCQFPVTRSIEANFKCIVRQMRSASARKADIAHFPECALTGYMGRDLKGEHEINYELLRDRTEEIMQVARELGLWVILGSTHRLTGKHKPHNSLYVINADGKLVDRYDKRFCWSDGRDQATGDLKFYSPGNHLTTFELNGVKCGLLICHEFRYPELYRQYKRRGVQLVVDSFHCAGMRKPQKEPAFLGDISRATIQTRAASNYIWVSVSNSSRRWNAWGSFFVRPDGKIVARARRHASAVLVNEVDTSKEYFDASEGWRDRAVEGTYHSGTLVRDTRSRRRDIL